MPAHTMLALRIPRAALLVAAFASHAGAQVADQLSASRPVAVVGPVTGTADGSTLFVAEGARVSIIQPEAGGPSSLAELDANFKQPVKVAPVGRLQPHPVRMIVDPAAQLAPNRPGRPGQPGQRETLGTPGYSNFLYIAAGRGGLWIMDASPSGENRAARVDDADPAKPQEQSSQRLCNDVALVTLGGSQYLLALFAQRDRSQLRAYPLSEVRQVLNGFGPAPPETGNELRPSAVVHLGRHPAAPPRSAAQLIGSYSMAMAVDPRSPSTADVYVAMLTDGIVKVTLHASDVARRTTQARPAIARSWGPVFGTGSWYAGDVTLPHREVFTDFEWRNQQYAAPLLERSDPPLLLDVALHRDEGTGDGHRLYAAVDPIGWIQLDLDAAWSAQMPIRHHEGHVTDLQPGPGLSGYVNKGAWPESLMTLRPIPPVAPPGVRELNRYFEFTRDLATVKVDGRWHLMTTGLWRPLFLDPPGVIEGFQYDDRAQWGGVSYHGARRGSGPMMTRVYRVEDMAATSAPAVTPSVAMEDGGVQIFVPERQVNTMGRVAGGTVGTRVEYLHASFGSPDPGSTSDRINQSCMTSLRVDPGSHPEPLTARRESRYTPAMRVFGIGTSLLHPDVIMTSDADGLVRAGVYYTKADPASGTRTIEREYAPDASGLDQRLTTGIVRHPRCLWTETLNEPDPTGGASQPVERQLCISAGRILQGGTALPGERYQIAVHRIDPSASGFDISESRHLFEQPLDRFGETGRSFFLSGMVDPRYDAYVQSTYGGAFSDAEFMFLTRLNTPDGLVWGRRDALMAPIRAGTAIDNALLPQTAVNAANLQQLDTHPEFQRFPRRGTAAWATDGAIVLDWLRQGGGEQPNRDRLKTWFPQMCRVRGPDSTELGGWVLAVPCGTSVLGAVEDPGYPVTTEYAGFGANARPYRLLNDLYDDVYPGAEPGWFPAAGSEEAQRRGSGLVQFWDFSDPTADILSSSPLPRLYLPVPSTLTARDDVARSSHAWHLETYEDETTARSFVFTGDWMGAVHCHEITDILQPSGAAPIARDVWLPPLGRYDRLTNNVRGLALDREGDALRLYVAVHRIGVAVLRVDFDRGSSDVTFALETILDDVTEPLAIHLRVDAATGERLLYVSDHRQGIRVYSSQ